MEKNELHRMLLDQLPDGVCLIDRNLTITYWNGTAERMTGFTSDEVLGRSCRDNVLACTDSEENSLCEGGCHLMATLEDGRHREAETYVRRKDGHRIPVHTRVTALREGETGEEIVGVVQVFSDGSPKTTIRDRLREAGDAELLDALTCLPNRRYLEDELSACLAEFDRLGKPFGVLFLSIGGLKKVRGEHGPQTAEQMIRVLADVLVDNSRPRDSLGRWSSGELFSIVRNVSRSELKKAAERLRTLVKKAELRTANGTIRVSTSIGGAVAKRGDSVESLLQRADKMLSESQGGGKNRVRIEGR